MRQRFVNSRKECANARTARALGSSRRFSFRNGVGRYAERDSAAIRTLGMRDSPAPIASR